MESVKVRCKVCGRDAPADSYVLDYRYKMMVCPLCRKDRKGKPGEAPAGKQGTTPEPVEKPKPKDWDRDDVFLEKAWAEKQSRMQNVVDLGSGKVKYRCTKCNYAFTYNADTKTPSKCPYCNRGVDPFSY